MLQFWSWAGFCGLHCEMVQIAVLCSKYEIASFQLATLIKFCNFKCYILLCFPNWFLDCNWFYFVVGTYREQNKAPHFIIFSSQLPVMMAIIYFQLPEKFSWKVRQPVSVLKLVLPFFNRPHILQSQSGFPQSSVFKNYFPIWIPQLCLNLWQTAV